MKPAMIVFLTTAPIVVLIVIFAVLFSLYTVPVVRVGLSFFTAATLLIGFVAAYDERRTSPHRRPLGMVGICVVGLGLACLSIGIAHTVHGSVFSIGTMSTIVASVIGAYVGQLIGVRLTSVFL